MSTKSSGGGGDMKGFPYMSDEQWSAIDFFNLYPYSLECGTVCAGTASGVDYTFPHSVTATEISEVLKRMPEIRNT